MTLLTEIIQTILHPSYETSSEQKKFSTKLINFLRLWIIQFGVAIVLGIIVTIVATIVKYDMNDNLVNSVLDKLPIFTIIFLTVIFAPISEELTFRLFLKYSPFRFGFSLSFITLFVLGILEQFHIYSLSLIRYQLGIIDPVVYSIVYIIVGLALGSLVGVVFKAFTNQQFIEKIYKKIFPLLFYLSAIGFGLMHISNYPNFGNIWYLAPVFVLPQLVIGFFLAYIRTKYGFKWSVALHAMHNFTTLIPTLLLKLGSENLSNFSDSKTNFENLTNTDILLLLAVFIYLCCMGLLILVVTIHAIVESLRARHNEIN